MKKMNEVNLIVAAGRDGAIGLKGDLIWRISADLRRFKSLTTGHPVIMGRNTWDSLPRRPLPGRRNIVVTRNNDFRADGAEVVSSPGEALCVTEGENPFIMGGEQIYRAMIPYATKIYLTEIDAVCPEADATIPYPFDPEQWEITEVSEPETTPDGVKYRYMTLHRRCGDYGKPEGREAEV